MFNLSMFIFSEKQFLEYQLINLKRLCRYLNYVDIVLCKILVACNQTVPKIPNIWYFGYGFRYHTEK
jgi:hypothetical protein